MMKLLCCAGLVAAALATEETPTSTPGTLRFEGIDVPADSEQHQVVASPSATLNGKQYDIAWNTILRTGESVQLLGAEEGSTWPFGLVVDQDGNPVYTYDEEGAPTELEDISSNPDFHSYLTPEGTDSIFQITHFESPRPAVMYSVELKQDSETCALTPASISFVDWSAYGGVWVPCAGSITPWGTHLGSEEYEPDARALYEATNVTDISEDITDYVRYFGVYPEDLTSVSAVTDVFKPYRYGYCTEISVDASGKTTPAKHYAIGRMAFELCIVLPDQRTTLCTDDGDNVMFSAFVADTPGDLSAGELYAGKFTQTSADPPAFDVDFISLGHATNDEIAAHVDGTVFTDLFEVEDPSEDGTSCPSEGFTLINAGDYGVQCLKVIPGMEQLASRLETRRYAATLGATTEFTKWEGIVYEPTEGKVHTSISTMYRGMEDFTDEGEPSTEYDIPSANHVRVPYNLCGCVFAMDVDTSGDWYKPTNFYATRCGIQDTDPEAENVCITSDISNPDNVIIAEDRLMIAEDTSNHINNALWAANYDASEITRVLTVPYGAETTGAYWHGNLGDHCAYLTVSVQHPYDDKEDQLAESPSTGNAGYVGYIGPFKLDKKDD
jgi:hypothetical protein